MSFTPKDWKDSPFTTTPLSAVAIEDVEVRLSDYTDERTDFRLDPTARLPFNVYEEIQGSDVVGVGSSDVIAINEQTSIQGDFTGITGTDAGVVWGRSLFATFGDPNGGTGVTGLTTHVGFEIGTAILDSSDLDVMMGARVWVGFFGADADGHVTQIESFRVIAPENVSGASGTADSVYGLFVEEVDPADLGASTGISLFVEGGTSRFTGVADLSESQGGIRGLGASAFSIAAGYDSEDPTLIMKTATGWDGGYLVQLKKANSTFTINDGTNDTFSLRRDGMPQWIAANAQTTVGAAGGASAPPATPTKYLKVKDSAGVTLVIPAYAAS